MLRCWSRDLSEVKASVLEVVDSVSDQDDNPKIQTMAFEAKRSLNVHYET